MCFVFVCLTTSGARDAIVAMLAKCACSIQGFGFSVQSWARGWVCTGERECADTCDLSFLP